MWSAASSNSTCGQSYTSCQSYATWNGCPYQGVFLTTQCSKRIQCTLSKTNYTAPTGYLIDETYNFIFYFIFNLKYFKRFV